MFVHARAGGREKERGIQCKEGGEAVGGREEKEEKEARKKTKTLTREGAPLLVSSKPSKLLLFCFFVSLFSDKIWYGYFFCYPRWIVNMPMRCYGWRLISDDVIIL